jgi:NADPH-dependent curcumin reductase
MTDVSAHQAWRLRRRTASGMVPGDLELVSEPIASLEDGQALVRPLVLSVEAASRIWMGHQRAFMPPVGLGAVMRGTGWER